MTNSSEQYEKLPGQLRGLIGGASLWIAADHLLSVRSMRVREEYKRFYLRDVQAIVVARAPRFHVSTGALSIAAAWLIAWLAARRLNPGGTLFLWILGAILAASWIYISAAWSCRCRIYTAVSGDELASVFRTWTARRFLEQIAPRIADVQGAIDTNWAEAAENIALGPGLARAVNKREPEGARSRSLVTSLFVASLLVSALVTMLTLDARPSQRWIPSFFQLLKTAAAITVLVQFQRGILKRGMNGVAVAALIVTGVMFYMEAWITGTMGRSPVTVTYPMMNEIDAGIGVILGLAGIAVSLRTND